MVRKLSGWLFVASFIIGFFSYASSVYEKDKLLTWFQENSDMFVMLKHWNDLPLISTAWKRLKTTPQVQEERKNFGKNVETFLEIFEDNLQIKRQNVSLNHDNHTTTVNETSETASQPQILLMDTDLKDNTGALVIANLVLESSQKEIEQTTDSSPSPILKSDKTLVVNKNQISSNPCSCDGKKSLISVF